MTNTIPPYSNGSIGNVTYDLIYNGITRMLIDELLYPNNEPCAPRRRPDMKHDMNSGF